MTTFTVQVKDGDAEFEWLSEKSVITQEIVLALQQVKQIQSGELEPLSLRDI